MIWGTLLVGYLRSANEMSRLGEGYLHLDLTATVLGGIHVSNSL